jgi:hydroxyacid-oxoacid transhydrogenase
VEPTDVSLAKAIAFARDGGFDGFVAVGGGSSMDTAKVMNLYSAERGAAFLDFVNAPVGDGRAVPATADIKPLIAVPTTAGTGSETTGTLVSFLVYSYKYVTVTVRSVSLFEVFVRYVLRGFCYF